MVTWSPVKWGKKLFEELRNPSLKVALRWLCLPLFLWGALRIKWDYHRWMAIYCDDTNTTEMRLSRPIMPFYLRGAVADTLFPKLWLIVFVQVVKKLSSSGRALVCKEQNILQAKMWRYTHTVKHGREHEDVWSCFLTTSLRNRHRPYPSIWLSCYITVHFVTVVPFFYHLGRSLLCANLI